jgi:phosphoribosyl-AMP cyclohydrolase / phosphoribosyl-ATP pyrophosphohydrolase
MSSEPGTADGMTGATAPSGASPSASGPSAPSGAPAYGGETAASGAGPVDLASGLSPDAVAWGEGGLVAGVVQDVADGRVLMVGWLDAEALAATLATGEVHFHSRSRGRLWRKGETSGNVLRLRTLALDCDGDALLLGVEPVGPTCHRGIRSCFDADGSPATNPVPQGFAWLESLWATIAARAAERPAGSYTTRLLDGGVDLAGRKVAEEATEVLLAAKNDEAAERARLDREETGRLLAGETADLLYHALVLLAERDLTPADVLAVLRDRHGRPGGR